MEGRSEVLIWEVIVRRVGLIDCSVVVFLVFARSNKSGYTCRRKA